MKNVRTTNVIRNSATSPATMNASRYSRMTVRADGAVCGSPSPARPAPQGEADRDAHDREDADQREQFERGHGKTAYFAIFLLLFLDAGGFTDLFAQVVQPAAAHDAALRHFDALDARAVQQERFLDADAVRDAAHRDRFGQAAAFANRHDALEHLNAFFAALDDFRVDFDRVARPEIRDGRLFLFLLDQVDDVHDCSLTRRECLAGSRRQPR